MKRILFVGFMVMILIVPFTTVNAINFDIDSPHILADYMPEGVDAFVGTRIGEDFIEELDAISLGLYEKLPAELGIEPYSLVDVLRLGMAEEGVDWDQVAAAFGEYAAFGLEMTDGLTADPNYYVVIEIDDKDAAEAFFLQAIEDNSEVPMPRMDGDNVVYEDPDGEVIVIFTPTHLIATNILDYDTNVEAPLSNSGEFTSSLASLVADRYNIIAYVSEAFAKEAFAATDESGELSEFGLNPDDAGTWAIGFTILAGNTFTIDIATQTVMTGSPIPVNVDFLNSMPSSTDAFIMTTDLTSAYYSGVESLQALAELNGEDDPSAQIPMLFGMTRLDLEEDVLSWTTGSYGVFFGADFAAILEEAFSTGTLSEINLDAGIVIEATDADLAANTAEKLGEFIATAIGNEDGITVTTEDGLTSIVLDIPLDPMGDPAQLEFVLTTTDQAFFFGTRQSYDAVIAGDNLGTDADFGKSTQYLLPNANSVWYINADGFVTSAVLPLAMMGPAIDNVFDDIVMGLDGGSSSSDDMPAPSPLEMLGDPSLISQGLDTLDALLSNMTVSTSIDGDIGRFRATMTVNP